MLSDFTPCWVHLGVSGFFSLNARAKCLINLFIIAIANLRATKVAWYLTFALLQIVFMNNLKMILDSQKQQKQNFEYYSVVALSIYTTFDFLWAIILKIIND